MDITALRRRIMARKQEQRPTPLSADKSRVARVLFDPPDHEANLRFVKRELEKAKREAEDRWNFDFENEKPIEGGRFEWVPPSRPLPAPADVTPSLSLPSSEQPPCLSANTTKTSSANPVSESSDSSNTSSAAAAENRAQAPPESRVSNPTTAASVAITNCDRKREKKSGVAKVNDENRVEAPAPVPVVREPSIQSTSKSSTSVTAAKATPRKEPTTTSAAASSSHKQRPRLKQNQITSHFHYRKRSKSKVKTQERKSDGEQEFELPSSSSSKEKPRTLQT